MTMMSCSPRKDAESVITIQTSEQGDPEAEDLQEEERDGQDLGSDEVWQKQEQILASNREKRERLRKRLERQKQIAEEKLWDEQERMELVRMENEIKQLNQKRSVLNPVLNMTSKRQDRTVKIQTGSNNSRVNTQQLAAPLNRNPMKPNNRRNTIVNDGNPKHVKHVTRVKGILNCTNARE